jgi:hypothetical protein
VLTWAIGDRAALVIGPHRQVVAIHERTVIVVIANVPTQGPFSNCGWRHASSGTGVANKATLASYSERVKLCFVGIESYSPPSRQELGPGLDEKLQL